MKKVFLGFLVLLIIYGTVGSKQNIYAQDSGGTIGELRKIEGVLSGSDEGATEKAAAEAGAESAKDELSNAVNQSQECDYPGANCCVSANLPNIRIPLQDKIINTSDQNRIRSNSDPISAVWCDPYTRRVGGDIGRVVTKQLIPSDLDPKKCVCMSLNTSFEKMCQRVSRNEQPACISCSNHGVWTALGCIDYRLKDFITTTLLGWGLGLAGVATLLCIIYAAFVLQISGGNPEKIKKAKERLTACIIGLLLIIFSVFILKILGIDILQIPGLNS